MTSNDVSKMVGFMIFPVTFFFNLTIPRGPTRFVYKQINGRGFA